MSKITVKPQKPPIYAKMYRISYGNDKFGETGARSRQHFDWRHFNEDPFNLWFSICVRSYYTRTFVYKFPFYFNVKQSAIFLLCANVSYFGNSELYYSTWSLNATRIDVNIIQTDFKYFKSLRKLLPRYDYHVTIIEVVIQTNLVTQLKKLGSSHNCICVIEKDLMTAHCALKRKR